MADYFAITELNLVLDNLKKGFGLSVRNTKTSRPYFPREKMPSETRFRFSDGICFFLFKATAARVSSRRPANGIGCGRAACSACPAKTQSNRESQYSLPNAADAAHAKDV